MFWQLVLKVPLTDKVVAPETALQLQPWSEHSKKLSMVHGCVLKFRVCEASVKLYKLCKLYGESIA